MVGEDTVGKNVLRESSEYSIKLLNIQIDADIVNGQHVSIDMRCL